MILLVFMRRNVSEIFVFKEWPFLKSAQVSERCMSHICIWQMRRWKWSIFIPFLRLNLRWIFGIEIVIRHIKINKTFRTYSKYVLCGSGPDSDNNAHPDPYQTLLNIHQKMFFFSEIRIHYEIKSNRYGIFKYLSEW